MTAPLILLGALLVGVALLDAVVTTLAAGRGGGPLTSRVGGWVWRGLRALSSGGGSRAPAYAGPVVLLTTPFVWTVLLWGGWAIVFSSADGAVVGSQDDAPASIASRVYYAGFVVFTLGVGDFVPGNAAWQIATALASFLGLFLITLSITYLVSVVSAAVSRRSLARDIHLSGFTGTDIVRLHWDGHRISSEFSSVAQSISSQILQTTQQHLAYPVLNYFHAAQEASSAPRALAALDDALLVMAEGLPPQVRPARDTLTRLRRTLDHYAATVQGIGAPAAKDPPLPDLARLREAGIPTCSDIEFVRGATAHRERRRLLDELVRGEAWTWPQTDAT